MIREAALSLVVMAGLLPLLAAERARACGPDFPHQLLNDRARTMTRLVEGSFAWEAAHLLKPGHAYVVQEPGVESADAPAACAAGDVEAKLYAQGASHWHEGNAEEAADTWRELLELPAAERRTRSTWAAFMLGRATQEPRWYQRTRALAREGFADELGLAASSLGQEARIHLENGRVTQAVRLYAEQAALGSESGRNSLLFVARDLLREPLQDESHLARSISDPIVQRLVASYLFTRSTELTEDGARKALRVVELVERDEVVRMEAADRLAAVAYRGGRFDLARRLVQKSDTPLSGWVRAKLLLRDGDLEGAAPLLARVSASFPEHESWGTQVDGRGGDFEEVSPRARVDAERGLLALQRKDYANALELLLASGGGYWMDAAHVAERVLTVDELVAFVERRAPGPMPPTVNGWGGEEPAVETKLRALLARRLLRADRGEQALRFFDDAEHRAHAARYLELRRDTRPRCGSQGAKILAAQAWLDAARLMRAHGMELRGYELAPDWAVLGGAYSLAPVESDLDRVGDDDMHWPYGSRAPAEPGYVTEDEWTRLGASASSPFSRFHYRVVAAEHATRAADLMPTTSHAFAASLCWAAAFTLDTQPDVAQAAYARYVADGPLRVDFASHFGRSCPAPAFERAFEPPPHTPSELKRNRRGPRGVLVDVSALAGLVVLTHVLARALSRRLGAPSFHPSP